MDSSIVQYHTKGEFQPVVPIVSSIQAPQPEETEREISAPAIEQPLHEISEPPSREIPTHEEEAYVPPVVEEIHEDKERSLK